MLENVFFGIIWFSFLFYSLFLKAGVHFKAGVHQKVVFWPGIMVLTQISRSRFKQSKNIFAHITFLRFGLLCKLFLVIFVYIW